MIVKESPNNYPTGSAYQYDEELIITINDWYHYDTEAFSSKTKTPSTVAAMINGIGQGNPHEGYNTNLFSTIKVILLYLKIVILKLSLMLVSIGET
jgi:hypothetical protein